MKNTGFYWDWTRETPELKQQIFISFGKKTTFLRESHHIWLTKLNNLAIALFVMLNLSFLSSHLPSSFCLSPWVFTSLALLSFSPFFFASHSYLLIALFSSRLVLHFPPLATLSVINMAARTGHVTNLAVASVFDSAVKACGFLPV